MNATAANLLHQPPGSLPQTGGEGASFFEPTDPPDYLRIPAASAWAVASRGRGGTLFPENMGVYVDWPLPCLLGGEGHLFSQQRVARRPLGSSQRAGLLPGVPAPFFSPKETARGRQRRRPLACLVGSRASFDISTWAPSCLPQESGGARFLTQPRGPFRCRAPVGVLRQRFAPAGARFVQSTGTHGVRGAVALAPRCRVDSSGPLVLPPSPRWRGPCSEPSCCGA